MSDFGFGVDLEKKLRRDKRSRERLTGDVILKQIEEFLKNEGVSDARISNSISGSKGPGKIVLNTVDLDQDSVFSIDQIKKLCIQYRLRFLDSSYFKGTVPPEAIGKIRRLEQKYGFELSGFKILAPAPMFDLRSKDKDPLLFIPIGNGLFYLVHKWGNDLSPFRKALVFPFRSFKTLLFCVAVLAFSVAMILPDSVYVGSSGQSSIPFRGVFFFYLLFALSGLTALYGFSRMKNFNGALWNSRYLD